MRRITRTDAAARDLDEIWDYIAIEQSRPDAADRLIDEIDQALHRLTEHSMSGEPVEHLRPATRRLIVHNHYLVFYDLDDSDIRVLRVLHGARLIRPEDFEE